MEGEGNWKSIYKNNMNSIYKAKALEVEKKKEKIGALGGRHPAQKGNRTGIRTRRSAIENPRSVKGRSTSEA